MTTTYYYIVIFLYGLVIGSFLNVCIYRIPLGQGLARERSHCMSCGHKLSWYELIPLFSYLIQRGKCRKCGAKISKQYPIIEALNALLYVLVFWVHGFSLESVIYCLMTSALIVLSVIDFRTYEIPLGINIFILTIGLVHVFMDLSNWYRYGIGLLSVSIPLCILYYATKGRAIGGGDVKLMAAAGLLLGYKLIIFAFFLGCIIASVCHIARMKISGEGRVLAMGPYLSVGIFIAALWGDKLIDMYMKMYL